jgi:hypothetical protein
VEQTLPIGSIMKAFEMMIDLLIKGSVQLSPRKINGHVGQQAFPKGHTGYRERKL